MEFRFYSTLYKEQLSIYQIADRLCHAFRLFSDYDNRFKIINIHLPKENLKINLEGAHCINELADAILNYNLKDIQKHDHIVTPTIEYKREFGFSLGFNFETTNGANLFSLNTLIGGNSISLNYKINETPIKQIDKFSPEWYYRFIKTLTKYFPIQFAVVRPRHAAYLDRFVTKFKYPIGLVSYFGHDLINHLPQICERFECEEGENGVIIITSEDMFKSEESLECIYNTLLEIGLTNSRYLI